MKPLVGGSPLKSSPPRKQTRRGAPPGWFFSHLLVARMLGLPSLVKKKEAARCPFPVCPLAAGPSVAVLEPARGGRSGETASTSAVA